MLQDQIDPRLDDDAGAPRRESESHVGALLRSTRESYGLTVDDVAERLHIRRTFIEAIEVRQTEAMPAAAYVLGFLRTYATFLGLDPDEVVRRYRNDVAGVNRRPKLVFPEPVPEKGMPAGAVMVVGLLLAGAAYGGWLWFGSEREPGANEIPPVPGRLVAGAPVSPLPPSVLAQAPPATGPGGMQLGGSPPAAAPAVAGAPDRITAPPAPGATAIAPVAGAAPATGAAPGSSGTNVAITAPSIAGSTQAPALGTPVLPPAFDFSAAPAVRPPAAAAALPPPLVIAPAPAAPTPVSLPAAGPDQAATPAHALPLPPSAGPAALVPVAPATDSRIVLRARSDAWVSLRDGAGTPLLSRVLRAGETYPVPDRPGLVLTTGNAGGLEVLLDGQPLPALGAPGRVRRDLPLEPARLRAALAVAVR